MVSLLSRSEALNYTSCSIAKFISHKIKQLFGDTPAKPDKKPKANIVSKQKSSRKHHSSRKDKLSIKSKQEKLKQLFGVTKHKSSIKIKYEKIRLVFGVTPVKLVSK